MIALTQYASKKVGVFGLGKAGEAAVEAMLAGGAKVVAWDDGEAGREALKKKFGRKITLTPLKNWKWEELSCLVLSPGIPFTHPAPHPVVRMSQKAGVEVLGEMELLARTCPEATYVGITGTNGKSTTTALIGHVLQYNLRSNAAKAHGAEMHRDPVGSSWQSEDSTSEPALSAASWGAEQPRTGGNYNKVQVGGNLGTPALALEPLGSDGIYVIELSSYQLDLIDRARFNIAILLNVTPDHLDRHGGMEGYVAAKQRIFKNQQAGDVAIMGTGCKLPVNEGVKQVDISVAHELVHGIYVEQGRLHDVDGHDVPLEIGTIQTLTGKHNWQNAACAYAALKACGLGREAIKDGMRSYPGLAHRMELIGKRVNVAFINDSKATNAEASANALAAYECIFWIAGGVPKAGGIDSLAKYFPRIAHAFLIGEAEEAFAATLEGKVKYTLCTTLESAVARAAAMAQAENLPGTVVLLSPACASFDQFKSFEHRGDAFRELVQKLGEVSHAA